MTESVIDAMSIMTMINNHKKYNYLALAGVGKWEAIKTYLDKGKIKKIIIATDNDKTNDNQGVSHAHSLYVRTLRKIILTWKENGNYHRQTVEKIGMMF